MARDSIIRIPTSGTIARLNSRCEDAGLVLGVPVAICDEGDIRGLPEPEEGVVYITSSVVAKKSLRKDVLCPDTSDAGVVRDGNGYIIGTVRFQLFQ